MTIPSTARRAGPYIGTGALVSYPFSFKTFDKADVAVVVADAVGTPTNLVVDSTALVTLNVDQVASPGGSVQYAVAGVATALPAGYSLVILTAMEYAQSTDLPEGGAYRASSVEDGLDALAIQIQQVVEVLGRALVFSPTDATGSTLPSAAVRASRLLGFDSSGVLSLNAPADGSAASLAILLAAYATASQGLGAVGFDEGLPYAPNTGGKALQRALTAAGLSPSGGDDTAAVQAYFTANAGGYLTKGTFILSDELVCDSSWHIILSPGTVIQQTGVNKAIFKATSKSNITFNCNHALLIGEGTWSAGWTGSSTHQDRAFNLIGCTNVTIDRPRIRNCGLAGIVIVGGTRHRINHPTIEGTHAYSTPITASGNFQFGIYLANDPVYGAVNDCIITAPDISGVAIGFLDEQEVGAPQRTDAVVVIGANIHDITGQHAFYLTASRINLVGASVTDIYLAGVKIQAGDANQDIVGVSAIGIQANNLGSQMFEVAVPTPFTGKIRGTRLQGVGTNVQRGISCARRVENLVADIVVETCTDVAVNLQDADLKDIDITVAARNCALDGIVITATTSTGIKLRPTLRECNTTTTAGKCGIRIDSASAAVEVFDADITDASTKMVYGIHNATVGSTVAVRGSIKVSGASDTAIRAVGAITEFPGAATLQGTNGQFIGIANVQFTGFLQTAIVTSSASNVVIWQQTLPPDSAVLVAVELVGILTGTSQRRAVVVNGLFYRVGTGICTIEGAPSVVSNIASGAFGGVYSLQSNGASEVILQVNSGGAAFYQWQARIRVTRVS